MPLPDGTLIARICGACGESKLIRTLGLADVKRISLTSLTCHKRTLIMRQKSRAGVEPATTHL